MRDNLDIEKLFKEKFDAFEGDVNPSAWNNIQQGLSATKVASTAATNTGMSLFMKAAIFTGGLVVATVGAVYMFGPEEEKAIAEQPVVQQHEPNQSSSENSFVDQQENNVNQLNQTEQNIGQDHTESPLKDNPDNIHNEVQTELESQIKIDTESQADGASGGTSPIVDNSGESSQDTPKDTPDGSLTEVESEEKDQDQQDKNVIKEPKGMLTFKKGEPYAPTTYQFNANAENYTSVEWDFGNGEILTGEEVEFTFEKPGDYLVKMTVYGEKDEQFNTSEKIKIEGISAIENVYNIITPNGDHVNDFFVINTRNIEKFNIIIQDINGSIVFENDQADFKWYGVDQGGNTLDVGSYFYTIYAVGIDGVEFKKSGEVKIQISE